MCNLIEHDRKIPKMCELFCVKNHQLGKRLEIAVYNQTPYHPIILFVCSYLQQIIL